MFRKAAGSFVSRILLVLLSLSMGLSWAMNEDGVEGYFADTYHEAREKFLFAAKTSGARLENYQNPNQGAQGEILFTDVATYNLPGAKTILVLGSGTHGVEGFAGSAIQVGLLREGITVDLPDEVGVLFFHALNPYGFSHLRRFTEDSVDLNRNFVNHDQPYPKNPDYDELAWLLEPASLSTWENLKARIGIAWYRLTKGSHWLQSAISRGQYNHPDGIFFGGNTETWSNRILQRIVERHLSAASRVILIDVHTGLGEFGAAEAITEIAPDTSRYAWMQSCWDVRITNPQLGDAVSPPISGSLKRGFEKLLPSAEVMTVSLEFGTYTPSQVLWALRAENHIHHQSGLDQRDVVARKEELKNMFYPEEVGWKREVWKKGSGVVLQTLECLN